MNVRSPIMPAMGLTLVLATACGPDAASSGDAGSSGSSSGSAGTGVNDSAPPPPNTTADSASTTAGVEDTGNADAPTATSDSGVDGSTAGSDGDVTDGGSGDDATDGGSTSGGSTSGGSTSDGSTSDGSTSDGSTGAGAACKDIVTFELFPSDATLTGAWQLGMSMVGEGEISVLDQMAADLDGSILFEPDIPCDDTWHIWVRYWESGADDSYFATLDGEPMPAAVFEGDCTAAGQGYDWAQLNWRDEAADPCDYTEDPWTADWAAGTHAIEFSYRESLAMGRILLTNDPMLVPGP